MNKTSDRKLEHIDIVRRGGTEAQATTLLEYVRLINRADPEVDLEHVDISTEFCGHTLQAPLMFTGMTGGHPDAEPINAALAEVAESFGIAIGVGSQRAAIEDPSLARTFAVVRERAPTTFVVANVGAAQLAKGYGVKELMKAIDMIRADAIAIHFNVGQELFQDEGDTRFSGIINKIETLVEELPVPIIIKDVGIGLSKEDVSALRSIGVRCFDVAGLGGTNWIKIEYLRSKAKHGRASREPSALGDLWGNPTAIAIMEARTAAIDSYIVGSGGIRDGLDVAKAIALGADIAGLAAPAMRALSNGVDSLRLFVANVLYQLKAAIMMSGGSKVSDLWRVPVVVWGRLREEAEMRGINVSSYLNRRLEALLWRRRT